MKRAALVVLVLCVVLAVFIPVSRASSSVEVKSGRVQDVVYRAYLTPNPDRFYIYALHTAAAVSRYGDRFMRLAERTGDSFLIYGQDTNLDRNRLLADGLRQVALYNEPGDGETGNFLMRLVEMKRWMVELADKFRPVVPVVLVGWSKEAYAGYFLADDPRVEMIVSGMFKMEDIRATVSEAERQWGCRVSGLNDTINAAPDQMVPLVLAAMVKGVMSSMDVRSFLQGIPPERIRPIWILSQRGTASQHDGRYFPLGVAEGEFVRWLENRGVRVGYSFGIPSSSFFGSDEFFSTSPSDLVVLTATIRRVEGAVQVVAPEDADVWVGYAPTGAFNAPDVSWKRAEDRLLEVPDAGAVAVYVSDRDSPFTSPVLEVGPGDGRCFVRAAAVLLWVGDSRYKVAAYSGGEFEGPEIGAMDVVPFIKDDRTFVPVRFVAEAFGGEVYWDGSDRRVDIVLGGRRLSLWIGREYYRVDGETRQMDTAPFIKDDRTFVPVRFVAEGLGGEVYWYPVSRSVLILWRQKVR